MNASAADKMGVVEVKVDRPTKGDAQYLPAPRLFRVLPDSVPKHTVAKQHAGSIFY